MGVSSFFNLFPAPIAELAAKERREHKERENKAFLCDPCVLLWPFPGFEIASPKP
jgi:hypothetical protein